MDIEATAAIERLTERVDALEASVRAGFAEVQEQFNGVKAQFTGVRHEMAEQRDQLRAEIRDGRADDRRHAQVLFESLQHDIRILADGMATIGAKLDARQP